MRRQVKIHCGIKRDRIGRELLGVNKVLLLFGRKNTSNNQKKERGSRTRYAKQRRGCFASKFVIRLTRSDRMNST